MRKPKIGDIVHYTQGLFTFPAIVQAVFSDVDIRVFVIESDKTKIVDALHSKEKIYQHWSWPEEEKEVLAFIEQMKEEENPKECEHDSYLKYRENHKPNTYKCMKCGIDFDKEKPQSKAEELIEKIYRRLNLIYKHQDFEWDRIDDIRDLIKEYRRFK